MSINLTDELIAKTKKGKLASAKQVYLDGDQENLQQVGEKTHQLEQSIKDIAASGGASVASAVTYDNATSGMTSVTAQGAIDELAAKDKSQDAAISTKAEKADLQSSVTELKAKDAAQDTEIAKKADSSDVDSQMQTEQTRVNAELDKKFDKENVAQELGDSEDKVVSQNTINNSIKNIFRYIEQIAPYDGNIGNSPFYIIDNFGNVAFSINKNGKAKFCEDKEQFELKINGSSQIVSLQEAIKSLKEYLNNLLIDNSSNILFAVVDNNRNTAMYVDNNGLHINNIVSHDILGRAAIVDKNGNIAFCIDKNGNIFGNFKNVPIEFNVKIGTRTFIFDKDKKEIILPQNLFTYNSAELMLPKKIPYVVGQQLYVYYESILYNGFVKDYRISSRVSNEGEQNYCGIFHDVVENDNITFRLDNSFGNSIESKTVQVQVLTKDKQGSLKICVVGDSKSENAIKQAEVLNLCEKDGNLSVEFVGTLDKVGFDSDDNKRTYKNCAKSGSGIPDWCCAETLGSLQNPFYDSTVESGITVTMRTNVGNYNNAPVKFSIEKAISIIGDFDVLWIDHGANQQSNDESFKCYDYIIKDVKDYNQKNGKSIKIVISIQEGSCLVGKYEASITNLNGKNFAYRAKNYIDKYDNREDEGVFICPQYLNVDMWHDFPTTEIPQNTRNKDVTKTVCLDQIHPGVNCGAYINSTQYKKGNIVSVGSGLTRDRNMYLSLTDNLGVEPSDDKEHWAKATNSLNSGYYKIADMYYATIRYIINLI